MAHGMRTRSVMPDRQLSLFRRRRTRTSMVRAGEAEQAHEGHWLMSSGHRDLEQDYYGGDDRDHDVKRCSTICPTSGGSLGAFVSDLK
jgi:hypothetical protein